MRRLRVILVGGILIAGVLGGPAVTSVAAQPETPTIYAGWACHTDGSGVAVEPTTHLSTAVLYEDPSKDSITCLFRDYAPKGQMVFQFGGECYFDVPLRVLNGVVNRIEFAHRTWIVQNGSAKLFCWDGEFVGNT